MKRRIYLSGPISGHEIEERRKSFLCVKEALESRGFEVFNPLENGIPEDAPTHRHMRADFKMLCECDDIMMLPKWNHSAGCTNELTAAVAMGCRVHFLLSTDPLIMLDTKME